MAKFERVLRTVGTYLAEPGYRKGNPLLAEDFKRSTAEGDNFGVVRVAGQKAKRRRFGSIHFLTTDGDAFKASFRKEKFAVVYKGKHRKGSSADILHKRAEVYTRFLNSDGEQARRQSR